MKKYVSVATVCALIAALNVCIPDASARERSAYVTLSGVKSENANCAISPSGESFRVSYSSIRKNGVPSLKFGNEQKRVHNGKSRIFRRLSHEGDVQRSVAVRISARGRQVQVKEVASIPATDSKCEFTFRTMAIG